MKRRMWILLLAGVMTFNQAGIVAFAQETESKEIVKEIVEVDKTALKKAIDEMDAFLVKDADGAYINLQGYTNESTEILVDAYAKAKDVFDNVDATQESVDAAISALKAAYNGLVEEEPDWDYLNLAINDANEKSSSNYTEASWSKVETALAAALKVKANPDAKAAEVLNAGNDLWNALEALEEAEQTVDKTALNAMIKEAQKYVNEDEEGSVYIVGYTQKSAEALLDAYLFAVGIEGDEEAIQDRVDYAVKQLDEAIKGLEVDKSTLGELLENSFDEDFKEFFTEASWAEYVKGLAEAQKVFDDKNATVDDVMSAIQKLNKVTLDLDAIPADEEDRAALDSIIKKAEKLKKADYTKESWKAFEKALRQAKVFSENEDLAMLEAAIGYYELEDAMEALVKVSTKPTDPTTPPVRPTKDPDKDKGKDKDKKEESKKKDDKKDKKDEKDKKKAAKTGDTAAIALLALQGAMAAGAGTIVLKRRKED